jgi:hypothetical protein
MSVRRSLAIALLLALGASVAPVTRAHGRAPVQVDQRYEITATLDVAAGRLDAEMLLELTNRSPSVHATRGPLGRAAGARLPDARRSGHGRRPAGGDRVDDQHQPARPARSRSSRARPADVALSFRLDVGRAPDAFTARTSRENGVLSFGQWFPIVSTEHDVYGIGDPQITFTADAIRLDLTTTEALPRNAVACPGLLRAPARPARAGPARASGSVTSASW